MGVVYLADDTRLSRRVALWFVSRFYPAELPAQLSWSGRRTRWCDVVSFGCQALAAAVIAGAHPEFAVLLVTSARSPLVAAFVLERVTARVTFPPSAPASSGSASVVRVVGSVKVSDSPSIRASVTRCDALFRTHDDPASLPPMIVPSSIVSNRSVSPLSVISHQN